MRVAARFLFLSHEASVAHPADSMTMKVFVGILFVAVLALQYRLWLSDAGVREVRRLEIAVTTQKQENTELQGRNEQLSAEVKDLKEGLDAVEERARSDLGMVRDNETFYQVVSDPPGTRDPLANPAPARDTGETSAHAEEPRSSQRAAAR